MNRTVVVPQRLLLFMVLYSMTALLTSILHGKQFALGPLIFTGGVMSSALTVGYLDIVTEHGGKKLARSLVKITTIVRALLWILILVVIALPGLKVIFGFEQVLARGFRHFMAGEFAGFLAKYYIQVPLFAYLKSRFPGFGIRYNWSSVVAQIVQSLIYTPLAFYQFGMPISRLLQHFSGQLTAKLALVACLTLLFIPLSMWVGKERLHE